MRFGYTLSAFCALSGFGGALADQPAWSATAATESYQYGFGNLFDWWGSDWGDVADGTHVTGMRIRYLSSLDPDFTFSVRVRIFNNDNGCGSARQQVGNFVFDMLPSLRDVDDVPMPVELTLDLTATGDDFVLSGPDLDADGRTDFGYEFFFFNMIDAADNLGVSIANPAPHAPGATDAWYYEGSCETAPYPGGPFAQYYFELLTDDSAGCPQPGAGGAFCSADLAPPGGDCVIDLLDLSVILAFYDTPSGATPEQGDLDGDGAIGLTDLAIMLAQYRDDCR